jgi:methylated-DNA-[protein]-cysteine S-methyltransferase
MPDDKSIFIGEMPVTPMGNVWVALSERGLVAVEFQTDLQSFTQHVLKQISSTHAQISLDPEKTAPVLEQIAEYLRGERRGFDLPIDWSVLTPFQFQALQLTYAIPYGETTTYGEIAARLGNPRAARAVGRAQATNPMPLVIPCHRVLGTDGKLHGYGAANGLETKAWLLKLESQ